MANKPTYEAEGSIVFIGDTENKSATFAVRDFVISVPDGQYPQMVKFQLSQDRCDLIEKFNIGDEVKVYFDLRGREWQGKYFTTLNAWKVSLQHEGKSLVPMPAEAIAMPQHQAVEPPNTDDLPF